MKKLLLLLIFVTQVFWAQTAFDQGNKFYGKENYEAAITSYESVVNSGKQSAEFTLFPYTTLFRSRKSVV